ncbi:MAG: 8-amino-7-oxononanoate synthase [Candidatus Reconcilbacillus cellulovorans]|uniref:8-amino-7-oxononanoate synthase n=1 Tax=Candidatus Reconcilbacillus cellulovorans TaxID=1906605 RepID=A0A2A6DYH1_9BACL|nr:MAG: 8-amino-7-oxononanoate synthase [Candidatus Reconcilbacillus cellulovorans]
MNAKVGENAVDVRAWMREELERLEARTALRHPVAVKAVGGGFVERGGRRLLNLASNDYLGLAQPGEYGRLSDMAGEAEEDWGVGATASRLIVGTDPETEAFERDFAAYKGTESCLLFGSGYAANVGLISALAGRNDFVFGDRLNHASIVDGAILSRARYIRYPHRDMNRLEDLLKKTPPGKRKLIVTDAVFSMDGSIAPLADLVTLKERYGALLMVDEAHSGGVFGEEGRGLAHALGLADKIDVQMGTFGKAFGCYGAYAAGDATVIRYVLNKARSFIYSTAPPPFLVRCIRRQWERVRQADDRRAQLLEKAARFRSELKRRGFDTGESECHIVPVILGDNARAVRVARRLEDLGVCAVAIRPPTVPEGTARLRCSPMAIHAWEDLARAVEAIALAAESAGCGGEPERRAEAGTDGEGGA